MKIIEVNNLDDKAKEYREDNPDIYTFPIHLRTNEYPIGLTIDSLNNGEYGGWLDDTGKYVLRHSHLIPRPEWTWHPFIEAWHDKRAGIIVFVASKTGAVPYNDNAPHKVVAA